MGKRGAISSREVESEQQVQARMAYALAVRYLHLLEQSKQGESLEPYRRQFYEHKELVERAGVPYRLWRETTFACRERLTTAREREAEYIRCRPLLAELGL